MEKPTVVILVEGGVVQSVVSESSDITYRVIDLDVDSHDPIVTYEANATRVEDINAYTRKIIIDLIQDNKDSST